MNKRLDSQSRQSIAQNLKFLRVTLRLSQRQFVDAFLCENGVPAISYSQYAVIEDGRGNLDKVIDLLVVRTGIESVFFTLPTDKFITNIESLITNYHLDNRNRDASSAGPVDKNPSSVEIVVKQISNYLVDGLVRGQLKAGEQLPSERELAAKFNVGRSTLREAMKVLSIIGFLDTRPGFGTFITKSSSSLFLSPLSWNLLVGEKTIHDITELRLLIECEAAAMAANRATPDGLADLNTAFKQLGKAYEDLDIEAFIAYDVDFHLAIAKCSQNDAFYQILITIKKILAQFSKALNTVRNLGIIYQEHQEILDSIINKDPITARMAMRQHLVKATARYDALPEHQQQSNNPVIPT